MMCRALYLAAMVNFNDLFAAPCSCPVACVSMFRSRSHKEEKMDTQLVERVSDKVLDELELEVAELIVEGLNLEFKPGEIDPEVPIFAEGLGLDSIDALEIALLVQKKYGVSITQG